MSADALALAFRSFRLPTMASIWEQSVRRAEGENWGYRRLLQHLCESEAQDRRERRVSRLLKQSGLPDGKTLGNLEEAALPPKIRRLLPTLLEGGFVERAENVLAFGLPGAGENALFGRGGPRVDPAPSLPGSLHADLQTGATVVDSKEGTALGARTKRVGSLRSRRPG